MRYKITHKTRYRYSEPVELRSHLLRLCPRSDGAQWLETFSLRCSPASIKRTNILDALGNTCVKATFAEPLDTWDLEASSEVRTTRHNPFDYLAEPWAVTFPLDYPTALAAQLAPYLHMSAGPASVGVCAPSLSVADWAQAIAHDTGYHVGYFLTQLTQKIPQVCTYQPRSEGPAHAASITLKQQSGTCRDFAVLFIAACRSLGLAARFVSGYQEGDLSDVQASEDSQRTSHDLHAWAEVYVPGGGWRGFDPTLGLAVSDRHIAIAHGSFPAQAAPVSGLIRSHYGDRNVQTTLESHVQLQLMNSLSVYEES